MNTVVTNDYPGGYEDEGSDEFDEEDLEMGVRDGTGEFQVQGGVVGFNGDILSPVVVFCAEDWHGWLVGSRGYWFHYGICVSFCATKCEENSQ